MGCRTASMLAATALAAAGLLHAQTESQPQRLSFEVASIKPSEPGGRGGGIRAMPGGQTYVAQNVPLRLIIMLMYKITDSQIVGGPAWMDKDLYDIEAKAPKPSSLDQLHEMFQNLLADRFKLQFHRATKEIHAYVMTVDKSGSKLKENLSAEPFDFPIKPGGPGKIVATHVDMRYFCWWIAQRFNTPVVDQTGLKGFYDFTFDWMPDLPPPPPPDAAPERIRIQPPDPGSMFSALREQLGLKVESRKAPVEVFVIDHVERPSAN
jgi:uncharacterized protein (TIGR03435 family)